MKTLFIRYNPDKYKTNGIYKYAKGKDRRKNLLNQIVFWAKNIDKIEYECSVVYMYFDEDNPIDWKTPINIDQEMYMSLIMG